MKENKSKSGVSAKEIIRLEKALNKKLPDFYKNFLMNYPDDLVMLGAPYNTVSELSLPNSIDRLIEISEYAESEKNILVIGVDGLGDCYYIILDDNNSKIYLSLHEDPVFLEGSEEKVNWRKSWQYTFSDMDELIGHLETVLAE